MSRGLGSLRAEVKCRSAEKGENWGTWATAKETRRIAARARRKANFILDLLRVGFGRGAQLDRAPRECPPASLRQASDIRGRCSVFPTLSPTAGDRGGAPWPRKLDSSFQPAKFLVPRFPKRGEGTCNWRALQYGGNLLHQRSLGVDGVSEDLGLALSLYPISGLDGLSNGRQLQMRVRVARAVEQVLEPRTPRDAFGEDEVGFTLHE